MAAAAVRLVDEGEVRAAVADRVALVRAHAADPAFNLYRAVHAWRMRGAPDAVAALFSSPPLPEERRGEALRWIRSLEDPLSCQSLQVKFGFSCPSDAALALLASRARHTGLVSAGAGVGYWEALLQQRGVDVVAFDANRSYPEAMRFLPVETAGPSLLARPELHGRALMLSWPDDSEESEFGLEALRAFRGPLVFHVGELFGRTLASNPWGQSTSHSAQLHLGEHFRCVQTVELPAWPGQVDALTVWRRVGGHTTCDGASFVSLASLD